MIESSHEEHSYGVNLLAVATAAELDELEAHLDAEQRLLDRVSRKALEAPPEL